MRGLKTLALRMDRHCSNAQAVAEAPAGAPGGGVGRRTPGLPSFPQYELAQRGK